MKRSLTIGLLLCAALPLGGCALFKGKSARSDSAPAAELAAAEKAGSFFTQFGRRELEAGRTGIALEAFERALTMGEDPAPALNGMGVAYARLGKFEAAHKLFTAAAARDPGNERYAANLARLTRSHLFALRHEGDAVALMAQAMPAPRVDAARAETALAPAVPAIADAGQAPQGRLVRVGRGEVRIHSAAPQAAPARTALRTIDSRFKPVVSVAIGGAEPRAATSAIPEAEAPLIARPRVVNVTGFKPAVRVDLAPETRRTGSGN